MTFEEWLTFGVNNGFCTPQFCQTHDEMPITDCEWAEWWENEAAEICVHLVRLGNPNDWDDF